MKISDYQKEISAGLILIGLIISGVLFGSDVVNTVRDHPTMKELVQQNAVLIQAIRNEREKEREIEELKRQLHQVRGHHENTDD